MTNLDYHFSTSISLLSPFCNQSVLSWLYGAVCPTDLLVYIYMCVCVRVYTYTHVYCSSKKKKGETTIEYLAKNPLLFLRNTRGLSNLTLNPFFFNINVHPWF